MEEEGNYGVPNDDILGGIRSAISRGETLKQAMIAMFNAGYTKDEIEDAARKYLMGKTEESIYSSTGPKKSKKEEMEKGEEEQGLTPGSLGGLSPTNISRSPGEKPGVEKTDLRSEEKVSKKEEKTEEEAKKKIGPLPTTQKVEQKVSAYEQKEKPKKKRKVETITIILIILLLLLVGVLVTVFMFKAELVEFFNKLFG